MQVAMALRIEPGPERLRVLTIADALVTLAEIKGLLLKDERRSFNQPQASRCRKIRRD